MLYTNKFDLNKYIGFYICSLLRMNKYKYTYGRVLSGDRIKLERIILPVAENGNPDWQFMENYIKSLPYSKNLENKATLNKLFVLSILFFNLKVLLYLKS